MDWVDSYQVFLFDFDGLLVDTERLHHAAYLEMARRAGAPVTWDFARFCREAHGKAMGFFDGWEKEYPGILQRGASKEELYEEKKRIYVGMLGSSALRLMEGAEPLLKALEQKDKPRAVVTNSPRDQIETIKNAIPVLRSIPLWLTREDYVAPKPSPEGYLKAIGMLAKPGDKIVGFEDTLKGLQSLLAAGAEGMLIASSDAGPVEEARHLGARHFESLHSIRI